MDSDSEPAPTMRGSGPVGAAVSRHSGGNIIANSALTAAFVILATFERQAPKKRADYIGTIMNGGVAPVRAIEVARDFILAEIGFESMLRAAENAVCELDAAIARLKETVLIGTYIAAKHGAATVRANTAPVPPVGAANDRIAPIPPALARLSSQYSAALARIPRMVTAEMDLANLAAGADVSEEQARIVNMAKKSRKITAEMFSIAVLAGGRAAATAEAMAQKMTVVAAVLSRVLAEREKKIRVVVGF